MANQSHRRVLPFSFASVHTHSLDHPETSKCYHYTPLDPSVDCIRLVILEPGPSSRTGQPIYCRLKHVPFSEKPKYEALSYTWGDESVKHRIVIDKRDFQVGINLLNALTHLRYEKEERVLWIDAICINQQDAREKSSQISIMPYIYTRAKTVLVWLGVAEREDEGKLSWELQMRGKSLDDWENYEQFWRQFSETGRGFPRYTDEFGFEIEHGKRILQSMCREPYWNRLWIIQEISLARRIHIHYGNFNIGWRTFIRAVQRMDWRPEESLVPLKLQKQLDEKYEEGHKLQNLIANNQQAICKEPRDHVYGFVGLATDCVEGFPLDYRKTLFEVWKDTVMFKNADRSVSQSNVIRFGRLVQKMLGGEGIATADEILQDLNLRMVQPVGVMNGSKGTLPSNASALLIHGRLVGVIEYFGPSYEDIISDLKTAGWKASINRDVPVAYRAQVREESDYVLEVLEEVEDYDLEKITALYHGISWVPESIPESLLRIDQNDLNSQQTCRIHACRCLECTYVPPVLTEDQDFNSNERPFPLPLPTTQRLFLLGMNSHHLDSPGRIGLASSNTRKGDYLVQIQGIARAVVLRRDDASMSIVGTAILVENSERARAAKETDLERDLGFASADFEVKEVDKVEMFIDVAIAYQLLDWAD